MSSTPVTKEDLTAATDSLRTEFTAGLTTAGVQIGAVEATLKERLSSLKAWGIAALVGGQVLAGLLTSYAPRQTADAASAVVGFLPFL